MSDVFIDSEIKAQVEKLLQPYEDWAKEHPELTDKKTWVTCPDCKGEGMSECYACGQDVECELCRGTGYSETGMTRYKKQREIDIKNMVQAVKDGKVNLYYIKEGSGDAEMSDMSRQG